MTGTHFYAILARMRHIRRWGLMQNTQPENLSEHSLEVAFLTHALIALHNRRGVGELDAGAGVLYALYHDCAEILTGDLPTPIKYLNPSIREAYRQVEVAAGEKLLALLPEELQGEYAPYLTPEATPTADQVYAPYVKAADRLSALIKCIHEEKQGNREFRKAKSATLGDLHAMGLPEVEAFLAACLPSFELTLDELDGSEAGIF